MGKVLRKFSKNQVMEIYGSISFQSSVSTYGSVTFQSSIKLVMEICGSVSEAGEFGPSLLFQVLILNRYRIFDYIFVMFA